MNVTINTKWGTASLTKEGYYIIHSIKGLKEKVLAKSLEWICLKEDCI